MKKYIVECKGNESEFDNIHKAVREAEKLADQGNNSYVWVEENGIREEEPFLSCEWMI